METRVDDKVGVASVDSAHCVPVVTECWQRLLDGFWVVGVVLKNNTNWLVNVMCELKIFKGPNALVFGGR